MMGDWRSQAGISYAETLLAVVVLAAALVPALEALQTAFTGSAVLEELLLQQHALATRLENVLAEPFADLEAAADAAGSAAVPSTYSDAGGTRDRLRVFLARYDADNADADNDPFTGTDDGMLWVRVDIEGTVQALETLTVR